MAKCSKCDASVPEQKAFCPECGAPMSAQAAERKQSAADLGATVIVPPSQWKTPPTPATGGTTPTPTPTAPPAAATPSAPKPTSAPPVAPAPVAPRPTPSAPTPPPVVPAPVQKGSGATVWLLVGVIVLLIIVIAFVLLRQQ